MWFGFFLHFHQNFLLDVATTLFGLIPLFFFFSPSDIYENTELPGGAQLNGQALYDEGKTEKDELEEELKGNLQLEMDAIIRG